MGMWDVSRPGWEALRAVVHSLYVLSSHDYLSVQQHLHHREAL